MSQFLQYLSASSLREPLGAVVWGPAAVGLLADEFGFVATVVVAAAGTTVGGTGDAACILMWRFSDTFLSARYEQCGQPCSFRLSGLPPDLPSSSSSFVVSSSTRGRWAQ